MTVLNEIYAKYGRDARKLARPHVALCQWRTAVEKAVNSGDQPEIIEYCRSLSILSREGAAWEGP